MNLYYTWRLFLHFANIKLGTATSWRPRGKDIACGKDIAYGCPYYKDPAIFHLFLKYHKWKIVYFLLNICLSAGH